MNKQKLANILSEQTHKTGARSRFVLHGLGIKSGDTVYSLTEAKDTKKYPCQIIKDHLDKDFKNMDSIDIIQLKRGIYKDLDGIEPDGFIRGLKDCTTAEEIKDFLNGQLDALEAKHACDEEEEKIEEAAAPAKEKFTEDLTAVVDYLKDAMHDIAKCKSIKEVAEYIEGKDEIPETARTAIVYALASCKTLKDAFKVITDIVFGKKDPMEVLAEKKAELIARMALKEAKDPITEKETEDLKDDKKEKEEEPAEEEKEEIILASDIEDTYEIIPTSAVEEDDKVVAVIEPSDEEMAVVKTDEEAKEEEDDEETVVAIDFEPVVDVFNDKSCISDGTFIKAFDALNSAEAIDDCCEGDVQYYVLLDPSADELPVILTCESKTADHTDWLIESQNKAYDGQLRLRTFSESNKREYL